MAAAERLKDGRALPLSTKELRLIMSNDTDDRSERPTQPDTQPPPSEPNVPSALEIQPAAALPKADQNSFQEQAMQAILDGMAELKIARRAFDADELLSRQTEVFAQIVTDRYEMIRGPIVAFGSKLDDLVKRVDRHDDRLDDGAERFQKIDDRIETLQLEMTAMRTQLERLEQLRPHLERLEAMLKTLKKGGIDVTAQATTTTPGEPPEPA